MDTDPTEEQMEWEENTSARLECHGGNFDFAAKKWLSTSALTRLL
jgi:hypothetical protein